MTADDFTNMVEAEIELRRYAIGYLYFAEIEQVCDCEYSEPDDRDRCASCGVKYREVGR